jgi:phage FluMu protein Com
MDPDKTGPVRDGAGVLGLMDVHCPKCESSNPETNERCWHCGKQLQRPEISNDDKAAGMAMRVLAVMFAFFLLVGAGIAENIKVTIICTAWSVALFWFTFRK